MIRKAHAHVRAQWMGALALFLVIAGGTAYAADTVGSADVIDNSLLSTDLKNNQAVRSADVRTEGLTGADIADQSGVDTCVSTTRIGQLCFRAENVDRNWKGALEYCANLDLRLPSVAEAMELALSHDLPDVGAIEYFWTDELIGESTQEAVLVNDNADLTSEPPAAIKETACVTTPTN